MKVFLMLSILFFIPSVTLGYVSEDKQDWILSGVDFSKLNPDIVSIQFSQGGNFVVFQDGERKNNDSYSSYRYELRFTNGTAEILTNYPDELISGYMMDIISKEIKKEVDSLSIDHITRCTTYEVMDMMAPVSPVGLM